MRETWLRVVGVLVLVVTLATIPARTATAAREPSGSITVLAASSLADAFTKIGKGFERKHRDADVTFSFGSSATLAAQIEQGAPVDVFASADVANMKKVVDRRHSRGQGYVVFARNRLEIAVETGNPEHIRTLADTVESGITLVLCAPEVPCGRYAREAYAKAGVDVPRVPTAENAKATLSKVTLGEADAAVVYVTDLAAAERDVDAVRIPRADNVVASYPIAPLPGAENPELAKAFTEYVTSRPGQRTLHRFGFLGAP